MIRKKDLPDTQIARIVSLYKSGISFEKLGVMFDRDGATIAKLVSKSTARRTRSDAALVRHGTLNSSDFERKVAKFSYQRKWAIRKLYGISDGDLDEMARKQECRCAICQRDDATLHIDHCHKTGLVRGLLCGNCNRAIGLLHEDQLAMSNAISYLRNPPALFLYSKAA